MEAIGRLARGVAHDFTNMLMVIQTSAEAIKMMIPEHDPSQEHLNRIVEAANKAGTFSGQLLAFSHKQPMSFQIRDLNKVVLGMKDLLRRTLKDNVKLSILTHTEPVYAKLDEGQIEQILVHMIVNAQDAMPNGGQLTVEVGRTFIEKEESTQLQDCLGQRDRIVGGFALLSVSDSGYGMNDEVKHHAFEPFYSTKGAGSSTGLGLSTVYGIIKQHEGHVTLYSNTGVGTCFTVYLPLVSKGREPLPLPPSDPLPNGTGMVLVVEDDPMVRKVLITILQPLGYSILEAEDGLQAVNLSREHTGPIALMITDISMPEMNGKDLAAAVRATRPETKVLFTSGYPRSHLLANKDLTDTDAVISKPLTRQSVARAVCETLGP
jgi:CheY-like chemotaxis protein